MSLLTVAFKNTVKEKVHSNHFLQIRGFPYLSCMFDSFVTISRINGRKTFVFLAKIIFQLNSLGSRACLKKELSLFLVSELLLS